MTIFKKCELDIDAFLRHSKEEFGLVRIRFMTFAKRKAFESYMNDIFNDYVKYRTYLSGATSNNYDEYEYCYEQYDNIDHYLFEMADMYCYKNGIEFIVKDEEEEAVEGVEAKK